uniref:Keratin n=1 Tax=Podarcis muralis TaxID=64176 RepID=A0A670K4W2_PODMU
MEWGPGVREVLVCPDRFICAHVLSGPPSACINMALCNYSCNSLLGVVPGVPQSCMSQIPPSEVTVQPPPIVVTIPGPILSSSCQPLAIGGYSPCASGYGLCCPGMLSLSWGVGCVV